MEKPYVLSAQVRLAWLPAIFYRSWVIRVTFMKPDQNPAVFYGGEYHDTACRMKGGTRFLHVFATCPTGWRIPSEMSVKIDRLAVQSNVFPLYEVKDGVDYTINIKGNRPVTDYLKIQGRFKHLTDEDFEQIQNMVDEDWELLLRKTLPAPKS